VGGESAGRRFRTEGGSIDDSAGLLLIFAAFSDLLRADLPAMSIPNLPRVAADDLVNDTVD
jgi:hypothetical protein